MGIYTAQLNGGVSIADCLSGGGGSVSLTAGAGIGYVAAAILAWPHDDATIPLGATINSVIIQLRFSASGVGDGGGASLGIVGFSGAGSYTANIGWGNYPTINTPLVGTFSYDAYGYCHSAPLNTYTTGALVVNPATGLAWTRNGLFDFELGTGSTSLLYLGFYVQGVAAVSGAITFYEVSWIVDYTGGTYLWFYNVNTDHYAYETAIPSDPLGSAPGELGWAAVVGVPPALGGSPPAPTLTSVTKATGT